MAMDEKMFYSTSDATIMQLLEMLIWVTNTFKLHSTANIYHCCSKLKRLGGGEE